MNKECVILFAKYPARGKVKTRLTPFLNKTQALELYVRMLADTTGMLEKSGPDILVYCYPAGSVKAFRKFYGKGMDCRSQSGKDLGERMKNAFLNAFGSGYSRALLVGCDIPGLSGRIIRTAFRGLKNKGITMGPAVDGGYYLIGFDMDSFLADSFTGIRWGSSSVFADTLEIIKKSGHKAAILPELKDLDTINDVMFFAGQKNRNSQVFRSINKIVKSLSNKLQPNNLGGIRCSPSFAKRGEGRFFQHQIPLNLPFSKGEVIGIRRRKQAELSVNVKTG